MGETDNLFTDPSRASRHSVACAGSWIHCHTVSATAGFSGIL